MHRALRGAARTLVAASALGLARPALAQPSPYVTSGPAEQVSVPTDPTGVPPESLNGHLEEMKVELAWLADVATFPCPIGARAVGGKLEVRGFVPNRAVRERTLEIARMHSLLPVVDLLQIHSSLALRTAGVPAETVRREANEVLRNALGERFQGLACKAYPNGQVILTGLAISVEEKLALGRKLRQVHGCTCVVNHLTVPTVQREGRLVTLVTSDGANVVPGPLPDLEAPVQHSIIVSATQDASNQRQPAPTMTSPGNSATVVPWALPPGSPPWTAPGSGQQSRSPYAPVSGPKSTSSKETASQPTRSGELETLPTPRLEPSSGLPPEKQESPKPTKSSQAKPVSGKPITPAAGKRLDLTTENVTSSRRATSTGTKAPEIDLLKVPEVPAGWSGIPAPKKEVIPTAAENLESTGVHVTTGTVLFEDEPKTLKAPPVSAAKLKQRVEQTCGKFARSVKVTVRPDKSLVVRVRVANAAAEKPVMEQILQLPEMASPAVQLEMEVGR